MKNENLRYKFAPYFDNPLSLSFYVLKCKEYEARKVISKIYSYYKMECNLNDERLITAPRWRIEEDYCPCNDNIVMPIKIYD